MLDSYTHKDYPFDALVDELPLKRDMSRSALFDIMVVLHNQQDVFEKGMSFAGTTAISYPASINTSQFDISFSFVEEEKVLKLSTTYNTDVYKEVAIRKLITYLEHFILGGIRHQDHSIAKIDYLPKEEKKRLLSRSNENIQDSYNETTLLDIIKEQCIEKAEEIAILHEDKAITYKTLDVLSNQLANYLIKHQGVRPADFVGIKLDRSEWLIISIIAVLKTGAVYVPIDVNYPEDRIRYIEKDSDCILSITKDILTDFEQTPSLSEESPEVVVLPNQLAYIIYTSGSTGKPKGVMLTHANASAFLQWCKDEFATTDFDVLYAVTSHCFDLSVYEMFFPLSVGKQVRILQNGLAIGDYVEVDTGILINTVPSVVENILENGVSLENVKAINMAGEPIPITLSNNLCNHPIVLRNLYGPSEDTTYSSCYHITQKHTQALPIGKPISGTSFYILSESLSLQGEGLAGELCISGKGLAQGYLNREVLTREKFIDNPFEPGTKLYRTGDLGYWMADGNIGFIGRKDHQVKLRGHRIELGEIEHVLENADNIDRAVVLIKELEGEKHIAAYLTGKDIVIELLRDYLSAKLPAYMMPSRYVILDAIPLTVNGKTDKDKLLSLEVTTSSTKDYVAPQTELERQLVSIWGEILGIEKIGITDNFFELGGHSLHITRMLHDVNRTFDIKLQMKNVFSVQNIQKLAEIIEDEVVFKQGITTNNVENINIDKNSEVWEI